MSDLSRYSFDKKDPVARRGNELARGLIMARVIDTAEDLAWPAETTWATEMRRMWAECVEGGDDRLALAVIASLSSLAHVLMGAAARQANMDPADLMRAVAAQCEEIGSTY